MGFRSGLHGLWRISILALLILVPRVPSAAAGEYQDEIERDFKLRSIGTLQISNSRGGVIVQGWAQDKIRVKARRKIVTDQPDETKKLLAAIDFRYRELDGDIELSAEYGKGLSIGDRLKERREQKTGMDMVVFAPANLPLKVWALTGEVNVRDWVSPVEVRTSKGKIQAQNIRAKTASFFCPFCEISAKGIRGSLRCMGGSGAIELSDVIGKNIYVESSVGAQDARSIKGEQLYVSKQGAVSGSDLVGRVEFHTREGIVDLTNVSGFASGTTETGDIKLKISGWTFEDKALVESLKGGVTMMLPSGFSGEIDAWSTSGKLSVEFPVITKAARSASENSRASRIQGKIGKGGEQLSVGSRYGDVKISKGL